MRKFLLFQFSFSLALIALIGLTQPAQASSEAQADDLAERGKYIATIAGCASCHTPDKAEFQNPQAMNFEQIQTIAFDAHLALDNDRLLAGGRAFDLGPAGMVFSRNITPDEETGIGAWTDEQIKLAIKTGVSADGSLLFPVMPYHVYNGMADADLDAVVAYLRSVPAVRNEVPQRTVSVEGLAALPYQEGISAPGADNPSARGAYLVNHVMGCTDCHTPIDPNTGAPQMDKYLAGRQPYEGPWGIVYGGNITPDKETGIGEWNDAEIKQALLSGTARDGRRLILMPWYAYAALTTEDADAVVHFLKNDLAPVSNAIPAASLNEGFMVTAPPQTPSEAGSLDLNSPYALAAAGVLVIALVTLGMFLLRRGAKNG